MGKVVFDDGTEIQNVPNGLEQGELENLLAQKFPSKMIEMGIGYDIEREYNIRDGVPDLEARFDNALARGNPDEIAAEFNERFGKGNWGVTEWDNQPYVTPEGLRAIGVEPKDERNVLLDGTSTDRYDFSADIVPELAIGAGAVIGELVTLPTPIKGLGGRAGAGIASGMLSALTGRGLLARSVRSGIGGGAGSAGVEGLQAFTGTQKDSFLDILQSAGTEGAIIGVGSLLLGAPFALGGAVKGSAKNIADRVKQVADELPAKDRGVSTVTLNQFKEAQERFSKTLGEDDAILLSLKTLTSDKKGGVSSLFYSKLEGQGFKVAGDKYIDQMTNALNKYKAIMDESIKLGDNAVTIASKLKANLSKKERDLLVNTVKNMGKINDSALGKLSASAVTVRGLKDTAGKKLQSMYTQGMKLFAGEKYYGSPIISNAKAKTITPIKAANFMNRLSKDSDMLSPALVYQALPSRLKNKVKFDRDTDTFKPLESNKPGFKQVTAGDLFEFDKLVRNQAYKVGKTSNQGKAENLELSNAIVKELGRMKNKKNRAMIGTAPLKQYKFANKEFSKFANIYRGKNGLFNQIEKARSTTSQKYLDDFVKGTEGAELTTLLQKVDEAFGPKFKASEEAMLKGLQSREELIGSIGVNYIRENNVDLARAVAQGADQAKSVAKATLKKIEGVENTIQKQFKSKKAGQKALDDIFKLQSLTDYKKVLRDIADGTPEQFAKASRKAQSIPNFKQAQEFVDAMSKTVTRLGTDDLSGAVATMKGLKQIDPESAKFAQDLMFTEYWGTLITASGKNDAARALTYKNWADSWANAKLKPNGNSNLKELFGETYEGLDNLALTMKGALDIDPVSGALSIAEIVPGFMRRILARDPKGALKPLSFMFLTKQFAPGSTNWTNINKQLTKGVSVDDLYKSDSKIAGAKAKINKMYDGAQKYSDKLLAGRNGLWAASVADYMEEANQIFPMEDEVDVQPVKAYNQAPVQPEPPVQDKEMMKRQIGQNVMNLMQTAQAMSTTTDEPTLGPSGLAEGKAIAEGVA